MKVLWLCNARFSDNDVCGTGTWLQPLAELVNDQIEFEVVNVTTGSNVEIIEELVRGIKQYVLPSKDKTKNKLGEEVLSIINIEKPNLIQIWGTENDWGAIVLKMHISIPAFIEMQGVTSSIPTYYWGGLSLSDRWKVLIAPISIIRPRSSSLYAYHRLKRKGKREIEIIRAFDLISVQSNWVKDCVLAINPNAKVFNTKILLRSSFYKCDHWNWRDPSSGPVVFTISGGSRTYKGIHILLQSIAILKNKYPKICLNIAGSYLGNHGPFLYSGYVRYLLSLIKRLGLNDNVHFVGSLNSPQIISHLQNSNVCVIPSFVESYCLALAEAMMVGTPCVVSYAGAMPEMAVDRKEALFYNSNDFISCAARIDDCLSNRDLSESLSVNAVIRKMQDCNQEQMIRIQLKNYRDIVSAYNSGK